MRNTCTEESYSSKKKNEIRTFAGTGNQIEKDKCCMFLSCAEPRFKIMHVSVRACGQWSNEKEHHITMREEELWKGWGWERRGVMVHKTLLCLPKLKSVLHQHLTGADCLEKPAKTDCCLWGNLGRIRQHVWRSARPQNISHSVPSHYRLWLRQWEKHEGKLSYWSASHVSWKSHAWAGPAISRGSAHPDSGQPWSKANPSSVRYSLSPWYRSLKFSKALLPLSVLVEP